MIEKIIDLHHGVFGAVQRGLQDWLPGLLARLVFAGVLLVYFLNSATKKLGDGVTGVFQVADNAYFQILPTVVEQYGYDASRIPFFPWDVIVYAGTWSEVLLPLLIVLGLFTRIASLGMMVFVAVQSYVDIAFHGVDAETVGAWFDRLPDAAILDQRALWMFVLVYLVIHGAGRVSIDFLLDRRRRPARAQ
ncbi:MAG TPA: DoxX family protein [Arenicellales bacterium]|nr:DoxX family protein [Arenicellales bacterium]